MSTNKIKSSEKICYFEDKSNDESKYSIRSKLSGNRIEHSFVNLNSDAYIQNLCVFVTKDDIVKFAGMGSDVYDPCKGNLPEFNISLNLKDLCPDDYVTYLADYDNPKVKKLYEEVMGEESIATVDEVIEASQNKVGQTRKSKKS